MKVLVTGGAGFIGSHICDALIAQGHSVAIVDDLSTGLKENIHPAARFYQMSISDPGLARVFEQEKPDIVSHQAAQMVIAKSVKDPIFDAQENILGSLNVILNCVRSGVKKITYASSVAVYGEPDYLPVTENHPVNPISPYGISKHTVEHYLYFYGRQNILDYVILRYSNVYGARQSPDGEAGVVTIFARQMLQGKTPTIFGPGDKTRDYIHVSDIVSANLLTIDRGHQSIYTLGTGIRTTDQKMFDTLANLLGYQGKPHFAPVRDGEIYHFCVDPAKARKELGWEPRTSLEEGLQQTIGYYRTRLR